jgi:hypothetical protein
LDNGKGKQVWLKKSLGTKMVAQANVRAKPVQIEFDQLLAKAEAQPGVRMPRFLWAATERTLVIAWVRGLCGSEQRVTAAD